MITQGADVEIHALRKQGIHLLELTGERLERGVRVGGVRVARRGAQLAPHPRTFRVGR